MNRRSLVCLFALILSFPATAEIMQPAAPATESVPPASKVDPAEAEITRKKAKAYADEKNWKAARDEAQKATELEPSNPDGWLILGTTEQRLEHPAAARDAFRKYLSLNPPPEKAAAVKSRVAEMEIAAEKIEKAEKEAKDARYGTKGQGVVLGFSPIYHPKVSGAEELGTGASTSLLLGYRMSDSLDLQFRYMGGTIPSLLLSDSTTVPNVKPKLISFGFEFNIPLNDPFAGMKGFQFFVPINLAAYTNWVSVPSKIYTNFGISGGTGAGARFYTGTFVVIDATFVYHFAVPLGDIEQAGSVDKPFNSAGQPIKGDASGPELRFSVTLLL